MQSSLPDVFFLYVFFFHTATAITMTEQRVQLSSHSFFSSSSFFFLSTLLLPVLHSSFKFRIVQSLLCAPVLRLGAEGVPRRIIAVAHFRASSLALCKNSTPVEVFSILVFFSDCCSKLTPSMELLEDTISFLYIVTTLSLDETLCHIFCYAVFFFFFFFSRTYHLVMKQPVLFTHCLISCKYFVVLCC